MVCSFAVAEEPEDGADPDADPDAVDEGTAEETDLISESNLGSKVRLLQLKRSAEKSYVTAVEVITVLSAKGEDTSELESILTEIKLVKEEIDALDPASETAVKNFVSIKDDIKDLNKQFRDAAKPLLTAEDKKAIREAVKESEEITSVNEEIKAEMRELNAARVEQMLEKMGVSDPDLIAKIKAGETTPGEVRKALKTHYKELPKEDKKAIKEKLRESREEKRSLRKKYIEIIKIEKIDTKRARLKARLEKMPEKNRERAEKRIIKKLDKLDKRQAKLGNRLEIMEKRAELRKELAEKRAEIRKEFKEKKADLSPEEKKELRKEKKGLIKKARDEKKEKIKDLIAKRKNRDDNTGTEGGEEE